MAERTLGEVVNGYIHEFLLSAFVEWLEFVGVRLNMHKLDEKRLPGNERLHDS